MPTTTRRKRTTSKTKRPKLDNSTLQRLVELLQRPKRKVARKPKRTTTRRRASPLQPRQPRLVRQPAKPRQRRSSPTTTVIYEPRLRPAKHYYWPTTYIKPRRPVLAFYGIAKPPKAPKPKPQQVSIGVGSSAPQRYREEKQEKEFKDEYVERKEDLPPPSSSSSGESKKRVIDQAYLNELDARFGMQRRLRQQIRSRQHQYKPIELVLSCRTR